MTMEEKHKILQALAGGAIERLKKLPQPVVRVFGPLTSGGYGYAENHKRFIRAEQLLKDKGYTVFDYFEGNHDESQIVELALSWEEVMEYYHRPIMAAGLISTMFAMPKWRESNGAKWEHQFAKELGLKIRPVPDEWFR